MTLTVRLNLKYLSITLFITGVLWAYICLGLVSAPLRFFFCEPNFTGPFGSFLEFLLCVGLCINAIVGYWIWWGWLRHFRSRTLSKNFFMISLIHHFIWLVFGLVVIVKLDAMNWPVSWIFLIWVGLNIILSISYISKVRLRGIKGSNKRKHVNL